MFKKTSKSKKSTINRDTLLIVQIFVLILIILLIINQVDSFKNNKVSYTEGFVDNQTVRQNSAVELFRYYTLLLNII